MFAALAHRFTWPTLKRVILQLNLNDDPADDEDITDRWVIGTSRDVGYNLTGFFSSWGVKFSAKVENELIHLPMALPSSLSPVAVNLDL